ncbi:MAG: lysophospholipid acyltransferase family protein [Massilibacteroides sp.]|nr:lysophospholipid acyltransferase family protein [Massilibacteroides sp.]MDD4115471.1 lysophospholipid acyltransferase family protein [Massilibacteroides sp.]MDD4659583.1 lysophospholipid acyltransferase family protein [Massilibacteroides sp.]
MLNFFYKIYVWLFFVPVFLVLTILTAVTVIVGCLLGGEKIFAYYPGMFWSKLTCYLALCPVRVSGRENINKTKSYVFVANHQGAFDIFLIYGFLGVPIKWVMKAGLGKIPFVGAACRAAGFVFVDNTTFKAAAKTICEAEHSLRNGASIAIFPEGSRTNDGKMKRFKKGAYQIAVDQHLSIIPITLNGPFNVLPIGSLNLKRHRLEMVIHAPVDTGGLNPLEKKNLQQLANVTQETIAVALWNEYK